MTKLLAVVQRNVTGYMVLAIIIGAQGAVMLFVHKFGNPNVDSVVGAILAGLAVLSVIGHGFLNKILIPLPAPIYSELQTINAAIITVTAAGGIITQYTSVVSSALVPWVALILQGLALIASLLDGLFKVTATKRQAIMSGMFGGGLSPKGVARIQETP